MVHKCMMAKPRKKAAASREIGVSSRMRWHFDNGRLMQFMTISHKITQIPSYSLFWLWQKYLFKSLVSRAELMLSDGRESI